MTQFHYAQSLKIIPGDKEEWYSPWEVMDGRPLTQLQYKILELYENLIYAYIENDTIKVNEYSNEIMNIIEDRLEINIHLLSKETSYNEQNVFMWSMIFYLVAFFII